MKPRALRYAASWLVALSLLAALWMYHGSSGATSLRSGSVSATERSSPFLHRIGTERNVIRQDPVDRWRRGALSALAAAPRALGRWLESASPAPAEAAPISAPTARFVDDRAVVLEYESLYDVHSEAAPGVDPRGESGSFDTARILDDLASVVESERYDFVLLYTLHEVPGWIHAGPRYSTPAANIGLANAAVGLPSTPDAWPRLRSVPHMNSIEFLGLRLRGLRGYTGSAIAFHEIGHYWGVRMARGAEAEGGVTERPELTAWLGLSKSHWADNWAEEGMPGIMAGKPTSRLFNAFDLYAMGLMGYDEARTHTYTVVERGANAGAVRHRTLTLEDLVEALSVAGPTYYEGDGRRVPDSDPTMESLEVLVVVIKGQDEPMTAEAEGAVLRLAEAMEEDWPAATWGRSRMAVRAHPRRS